MNRLYNAFKTVHENLTLFKTLDWLGHVSINLLDSCKCSETKFQQILYMFYFHYSPVQSSYPKTKCNEAPCTLKSVNNNTITKTIEAEDWWPEWQLSEVPKLFFLFITDYNHCNHNIRIYSQTWAGRWRRGNGKFGGRAKNTGERKSPDHQQNTR